MATRRLPVIQEPTGEDAEAAARPHWHWVMIGAGFLVTSWTPLAYLLFRRIAAWGLQGPLAAAIWSASFALASLAAGYLVARFGPRTRPGHGALAGATAALGIWLIALAAGGFGSKTLAISSLLVLSALNGGFGALGGWLQRRKKSHG